MQDNHKVEARLWKLPGRSTNVDSIKGPEALCNIFLPGIAATYGDVGCGQALSLLLPFVQARQGQLHKLGCCFNPQY